MDTLLFVLLGVASIVVVGGALTSRKKEDSLHAHRPRREESAPDRPVFLGHDKQWTPVTTPEPGVEKNEATTQEVAPEETTVAP